MEGGGGTPPWLPSGPVAALDLQWGQWHGYPCLLCLCPQNQILSTGLSMTPKAVRLGCVVLGRVAVAGGLAGVDGGFPGCRVVPGPTAPS